MNAYYDSLKRLFDAGKITSYSVRIGVAKGWISVKEYQQITGEAYVA